LRWPLQSFPFAFFSLQTVCALVILFGTGAGVADPGSLELASEEVAVMGVG
jgi:hypothetical protein